MIIFRYSLVASALAWAGAAIASPPVFTPRNDVETMVLTDPPGVNTGALKRWIDARAGDEPLIIKNLNEAGFRPQPGSPRCRYFGYVSPPARKGVERTASVALCRNPLSSMVLLLDLLPKRVGKQRDLPVMSPTKAK